MVERGATTFLFVFFFLMLGVLVASVVYNYQLLQSSQNLLAWLRSSESAGAAEVAPADEPRHALQALLEEEVVLGTKLSLLADTVPYPVIRLPRDPASVFAPLPTESLTRPSLQ